MTRNKGWTDSTGNYHKADCDCGFCNEPELTPEQQAEADRLYQAMLATVPMSVRKGKL